MKKAAWKSMITWVLVLAILAGVLPSGFALRAKAEGENGAGSQMWDYSVTFTKSSDDSSYLDDYFSTSDYKDYQSAPYGTYWPSRDCSSGVTGLSFYADMWSSAKHVGASNPGAGYLRPIRMTKDEQENPTIQKVVHMLTYKVATYTDFYTEYTFIPGYSEWGLAFGAGDSVFPISWDGDSSNDTGVALFYKDTGELYIGGTIAVNTAVEATGKTITNYPTTSESDALAYLRKTDAIKVDLHNEDDANAQRTVCVQVVGNELKVWDKALSANVVTVTLNDKYQGGYVSLVTNQREHGGFVDFAIREGNWDYNVEFVKNQESHSYLDSSFITYDFSAHGGESSSVRKPGDNATEAYTGLSSITKRWVSTVLFGDGDTPGATYLRPTRMDKVAHILKYIKSDYQNFYTEYSFIPGESSWGLAFGIQGNEVPTGTNKGKFPITWDENSSNDTGVALFYKATGELYIGGAIDKASAQEKTGKVVSRYAADYAATAEELQAMSYVQKAEAICVDLHDGTDNANARTLCVEVQDGVLKVWDKNLPQNVVSVNLTSKYQKGYVALVTDERANGGFKDFAIKGYADTSSVIDPMDTVAELFEAYRLADASVTNQMESVAITDKWKMEGDFLVSKKSSAGDVTSKVDVLTYKEKAYSDFEMTFTYQQSYNRIGVLLGAEKGVYPLGKSGDSFTAEGGIVFYMEAEGNPIAHGDFLNGYTTASEVKRRLTGLNLDNFVDQSGSASSNVSDKTEHTVKIVVKGKDLYVYVDKRTEPVMYLALPDSYAGGYVSLFSAANNGFGFKDYVITEDITTALPEKETPENVYYKNFTELHGLQELKADFAAFTLENTKEKMQSANVEDAFTIVGKGIRRNAAKIGNDWEGFNILTLTKKKYQNFELELTYSQSWQRYGVMIGGKLGEFAVEGNSGNCRGTLGAVFAYTEAEGYRNIKGGLTAGMTTIHNDSLRRDKTRLPSFENRGSVQTNVEKQQLHILTIRVVGDWITMVVDGNEDSRLSARIDGYNGGYISLVTNGSATGYGFFQTMKITELGADAVLGDINLPMEKDGFLSLNEMKNEFEAYYLNDVDESATMSSVNFLEKWWFNAQGFLARYKTKAGSETKNVDVLTYKKKKYTDFQVELEVQQTYNRTGLILGAEKGQFPIASEDDIKVENNGLMIFVEAEGVLNAMGDFTNGYTSKDELRRRITTLDLPGFKDEDGSVKANVENKTAHKLTIVVKNKELYVFVDDSDRCAMYLTLPDDYAGGYVSLFSSAGKEFGVDKFVISETITKTIPQKEKLVSKSGNEVNINFNVDIPDATGLSAYYLKKLDKTGSMEQRDLYANWMLANGKLNKQSYNVGTDDTEKVSVLTYTGEKYENFVATFEYQLTRGRLMFFFGAEEGKYPIYNKNGHHENGGVMLYAEADLGSGGGICALGDVKISTEGYRPMYRELSYAPGYYAKKADGELRAGVKYTMTVVVYNKHCSVYIDGFGLVSSFDLSDEYKEGYISLASTSTKQHGFTYLNIQKIEDSKAIKNVSKIKDITVKSGTAIDKVKLPASVEVTNANSKKVKVPVVWTDRGYDATLEGEYQFVGTLQMENGMTNPGMLTALLTVRVRDSVPKTSRATNMWTFDTASDLLDFKSFYIKNAKKEKAVESDSPAWFVRKGKLQRDQNRASNGSETSKLSILTYTGATYKNFELEVDFTQQYSREMVMFGSKTPGQYFDYENPQNPENPICVYVEFEGRRNALGNVVNTNFYNRTSSNIPNAREDYAENDNYYDKTKKEDMTGTMRHLKLRVVGDTFTIWLDNQETVFEGKIGEGYEGGYISLVSTAQKGKFDNLKITRLDEEGKTMTENLEVTAKDNLDISYTKLEKTEEPKTEQKTETETNPIVVIVPIVAVVLILATVVTVVVTKKKNNKKKEGNS